jgi:NAD(P)-dependent dehydrogenase (short-subunit alcohol dehydrogenase family)
MDTGPTGRRFEGKVAVVTGSSSQPGIGSACAARLGLEGARVVINGRSKERLEAAENDLLGQGFEVAAVVGAMEDDETAARLVDAAIGSFGQIDLLVNTVGGSPYQGPPLSLDRASYMQTIALNTWCSVALVQEAMRQGLAEGSGAVVNISSGTVHKTTPSMIAYAASKAALNALTRTLARDLGPRGVRVNGVAPGLTKTSATRPMWEADGGAAAGSNLVLGRLTRAEDIANAVLFLLSDQARQITGVVIDVDGGNHLMGGWSPMAATPPTSSVPASSAPFT